VKCQKNFISTVYQHNNARFYARVDGGMAFWAYERCFLFYGARFQSCAALCAETGPVQPFIQGFGSKMGEGKHLAIGGEVGAQWDRVVLVGKFLYLWQSQGAEVVLPFFEYDIVVREVFKMLYVTECQWFVIASQYGFLSCYGNTMAGRGMGG
jgi:hypothetical protein